MISERAAAAAAQGLYQPDTEHDACGVGFVANIRGRKTHKTVLDALQILHNLDHRGAVGADPLCGDGAGILIQIPDRCYREEMRKLGVELPQPGDYGVGMIFLPQEQASRVACEEELERTVRAHGQVVLGWRDVPVDRTMPMSQTVRGSEPVIRQIFIGRGPDVMVQDALERKLYVIRKTAAHNIRRLHLLHGKEYFVPSMSTRTVVYKGLLLADQVGRYYLDLSDERVTTAIAVVHQRFSTNTFPSWELAHPYRYVAHNGEINTVRGNFNWIRAREGTMKSAVLGDDLPSLSPLIYDGQSDTACLDNVLELLVMSGYPLAQAVMMLLPEPWERASAMDPRRRAFYEYYASMMEPWDGPAALVFTDGERIGATLDRNGLRPQRYVLTDDDTVVMASEAGVLPIEESRIVKKGRLEPGRMFYLDTGEGRIVSDEELKARLCSAQPYQEWVQRLNIRLDDLVAAADAETRPQAEEALPLRQAAFGYTLEDLKFILEPMCRSSAEPVGSMGNDAPPAVLSDKHKSFFQYFKQLFAQVTNPPIDPIREELVTSLISFIGPKPDLLDINNVNPPRRLEVTQPLLSTEEIATLRHIDEHTDGKFRSCEIDITYPAAWGENGAEARLASVCAQAADAVRSGSNILIVTDRAVSRDRVSIPMLLAVSALHHHLIAEGIRTATGLVVESGAARETHHFALLAGYGAEAVHPWLAVETIEDMVMRGLIDGTPEEAVSHYFKAIGKGLTKVMAKMGISTYMSYRGAAIFEAVGLDAAFVDRYFRGTSSQVGGLDLFDVMREALALHQDAYAPKRGTRLPLPDGGEYAWRPKGEEHMWTPEAIVHLQAAVRTNDVNRYRAYADIINRQSERLMTFRGCLQFNTAGVMPVPLEEVEPASEIVRRFATGAMSLGSISAEAHATIAVAANRIGARSNTGEGGEDIRRYETEMLTGKSGVHDGMTVADVLGKDRIVADIPLREGDSLRSRIKQVASGRFGVTAQYLASADQIQIKMAQGAKPGEGGQLPGHKVSDYIAELRYSVPGVGLISPPPHHDIYSIEDLAQLIHDLKCANDRAEISVKLVSENGVGTVAAGVAKAKADHIVVSGYDGGTGASPLSSVRHAGTPWELGLTQVQQTLVLNGLRSRVALQVDGQIKTGRDVVIGALLGADEFGFATAPLVTLGCLMMRKCHVNTCPVGIATQDPVLRRQFAGRPEHLINYFFMVAEEARALMAQLGIRRFEDLIGRCDLLSVREDLARRHPKAERLDLSRLLYREMSVPASALHHTESQHHCLDGEFDTQLIADAEEALAKGTPVTLEAQIRNVDRTALTRLSAEVVRRCGSKGLPPDTIRVQLRGTAGQSFGSFLAAGVSAELTGQANDYVGKGLSGGRIVVRMPEAFRGRGTDNIICGNTTLYGATSGEAYFNGTAGERFAVRLSGASAVVEGTGDHACEYMTGGTVVVLGKTGRNFASGMSGGVCYVYDEDGSFEECCNKASVVLERLSTAEEQARLESPAVMHMGRPDEAILRELLERHEAYTQSSRAAEVLAHWDRARSRFVKVFPVEYRAALIKRAQLSSKE